MFSVGVECHELYPFAQSGPASQSTRSSTRRFCGCFSRRSSCDDTCASSAAGASNADTTCAVTSPLAVPNAAGREPLRHRWIEGKLAADLFVVVAGLGREECERTQHHPRKDSEKSPYMVVGHEPRRYTLPLRHNRPPWCIRRPTSHTKERYTEGESESTPHRHAIQHTKQKLTTGTPGLATGRL